MKVHSESYCTRCGIKPEWHNDARGKLHNIIIPTDSAGGSAVLALDDYCWDCYGKVCARLKRIYNDERSKEVEFDVNISVKVKKTK